jgi:hypothetical protein
MNKLKAALIIDNSDQSFLNFDLYKKSLNSEKYSIEYLIIQDIKKNNFNKLFKRYGIKRFIDKALFGIVEKFENFLIRNNPSYKDILKLYKLDEFKIKKIYVAPIISKSGFLYSFSNNDLDAISKLNLDILIRGGSGILRGEILEICRFGILSFHHGNNDVNRGGPPGFWEVYNNESTTGFVIQKLTNELDGGDVLFKGNISTSFLYILNRARLYKKSSIFMHELIERHANAYESINIHKKKPYAYPLYVTPTTIQTILYIIKSTIAGLKKIWFKILNKKYRWSVSYQFTDNWQNTVLRKSKSIKNPPFRFLADPFTVSNNNISYIYLEDFDYRTSRGCISVYEINKTGYNYLGVAIEEDFHLSYPFVFNVNNTFYMIPESINAGEIRLYKCIDFPLKWEFEKAIIKNIKSADTSIFYHDDKWWLLTNKDTSDLGDYCSELHIFYSDSFNSENWISHPGNPVIFDSICARNGGFLLSDNKFYRVFQKQGFDMYGESMGIAEITELTTSSYVENILFDMPAKYMPNILGNHTFSYDSGLVCFDHVKIENYKK